jgi:hypothetical protein
VHGGSPVVEADDVLRQVLEGLSEANAELGTNYQVAAIRFVTDDTPSSSTYRFLAKSIVERVASQDVYRLGRSSRTPRRRGDKVE